MKCRNEAMIVINQLFKLVKVLHAWSLNEAKTLNQFPVMKMMTKIFQKNCAISVHKKAAKKHPS